VQVKIEPGHSYELRQQQRYMERQIRHWKRREAAAITPEDKAKATAKVRQWQGSMRQFIDDTGRLRQRQRESITRAR
jgi:L-ascorbate metabolism protein UlaG (beta-lactamase superfamily)